MSSIIAQYWDGILQKLRAEVDQINSQFEHQGVKGEGNEKVLRDLLTDYLPKRYGVGTGVVIDRHGHQSRQCDIVIYDTMDYPSLLSLSAVHFYPVDIVYAVIEVKTTITSQTAADALANIASVRALDLIPDQYTSFRPTREPDGMGFGLSLHHPTPPVGFVFGYNSTARQFETFKHWFAPTPEIPLTRYPGLVGCLDQGLLQFVGVNGEIFMQPVDGALHKGWLLPLRAAGGGHAVQTRDERLVYEHDGRMYPVTTLGSSPFAVDQGRILLAFLLILQDFSFR